MKIFFEHENEQEEIASLLSSLLKDRIGSLGSCVYHCCDVNDCPDDCNTKKLKIFIDTFRCRRCEECRDDDHHFIDSFELPGMLGCKHCPALIDSSSFDLEDND